MFTPLAQSGATLFSLQKGPAAAQAASAAASTKLINFTAGLSHFGDTAALISHLDLVVCVDTAVAHLAGALGKKVWTLLPFGADWRWMLEREDTPWYPTMRLFRQKAPGQWSEVFARVADELGKMKAVKS
jgi:ADP-heptose:LPS heptosyltransferase